MKTSEAVDYMKRWTPGGSQTGSKAPGRCGPGGSNYPAVATMGQGAHVYDVEGRVLLDFVASLAAVGLGHCEERVVRSVMQTIQRGALLSLPTLLEGTVSERLCGLLGWPEQVRWLKTGSEATQAAVRVARCATGRSRVLTVRSGYHGWHDWFQAVKPHHPGIPEATAQSISGVAYGDQEWTEGALRSREFAAFILEPVPIDGGVTEAQAGAYLRWLRRVCTETGTALVFDEMVWGFRLAIGGGGAFYGVQPDLATFGKAMGNGFAVACLVGRRELMEHAALASGTFGGDGVGLAAALRVMAIYDAEPVVETLWARGHLLRDGFNAVSADFPGVGAACVGVPVHPVVTFTGDGYDRVMAMSVFLQELARRGVLWHPAGANTMYCHTEEHVRTFLAAAQAALAVVYRAVSDDTLHHVLDGTTYAQAFSRARL